MLFDIKTMCDFGQVAGIWRSKIWVGSEMHKAYMCNVIFLNLDFNQIIYMLSALKMKHLWTLICPGLKDAITLCYHEETHYMVEDT